jgi:hypothetical protein
LARKRAAPDCVSGLNSATLRLMADYHQIHLFDEGSDTDLGPVVIRRWER